ncbi:MAG: hypothetical protein GJ677_10690 [Rhodobacteraceae bacterium]|nr:hypothetical protein [Paracoccaceae bacterium]
MGMKLPQGVFKRGKGYSVRVTVPTKLVDSFGKKEIIRGLGTRDKLEAALKAPDVILEIKKGFSEVGRGQPVRERQQDISVRAMAHRWLSFYQVVIGCHAWLLDPKDNPSGCVGDRDLIIIDEVPSQSQVASLSVGTFNLAREFSETNVTEGHEAIVALEAWAEKFREQTPSNSFDQPEFPDPLSVLRVRNQRGLVIEPDSPLDLVLRFAQAMYQNRAFVRCKAVAVDGRQANQPRFVSFEKWTPFFPDAQFAVFSATVHLDGFQVSPYADRLDVVQGSLANYPYMVIREVPWVLSSSCTSDIVCNRDQRNKAVAQIMSLIRHTEEGSSVLIVVPKKIESDVIHAVSKTYGSRDMPKTSKTVFITHYGCDVGSNAYRECTEVILWSNYYVPAEASLGEMLHFAEELVSTCSLSEANSREGRLTDFKQDKLYANIKQMGARGSCRYIDDNGNALPMRLWVCWKQLDVGRLDDLFPGHKLERHVDPEYAKPTSYKVTDRVLDYLVDRQSEQGPITLNAIADAMGMDKANLRKQTGNLLKENQRFAAYGWKYVKGVARSRTDMNRFEQV